MIEETVDREFPQWFRLRYFAVAILLSLGVWMSLFWNDWQNWLGFSQAAYFKYGTNYAFSSGPGPMIEAALFQSTIIVGLWHGLNCHREGCWRIGKHKVNGTPWCSHHQHLARPQATTEEILMVLSGQLADIISLMRSGDEKAS